MDIELISKTCRDLDRDHGDVLRQREVKLSVYDALILQIYSGPRGITEEGDIDVTV